MYFVKSEMLLYSSYHRLNVTGNNLRTKNKISGSRHDTLKGYVKTKTFILSRGHNLKNNICNL